MRKISISFFLLFSLLLNGAEIIHDGKSIVSIYLPDNPTGSERFAAEELQSLIKKISGATINIIVSSSATPDNAVFVGRHPCNNTFLMELQKRDDDHDSFVIATREHNRVHLTSLNGSGTLYAVWQLLEKIGVRFLMPGKYGTAIPHHKNIELPEGVEYHIPKIKFRSSTNYHEVNAARVNGEMFSPLLAEPEHGITGAKLYAMRSRLNGNVALEARDAFRLLGGGHSYRHYLPAVKYGKTNPDFFAVNKNRRVTSGQWQLCMTSKSGAAEFADNVCAEISRCVADGVPQERIIVFVSPNDYGNHCECIDCMSLLDPQKRRSSAVLHYANMVAGHVLKKYPGVKITYYVYDSYGRIPTKVTPAPGVYPCLTAWSNNYALAVNNAAPLYERFKNKIFAETFEWFARHASGVLLYPYYGHYEIFTAWPMQTQMTQDIRAFSKYSNFTGINSESHLHWGTQTLNLYLFPRLMWNPDADTNALIKDFCQKAYGPAADLAEQYYKIQQKSMDRGIYVCGNGIEASNILTSEAEQICNALAIQIRNMLPDIKDEGMNWRIRLLLTGWDMTYRYTQATRQWRFSHDPASQQKLKDIFSYISEYCKTELGRFAVENRAARTKNLDQYAPTFAWNHRRIPLGTHRYREALLFGGVFKFYVKPQLAAVHWGIDLPHGKHSYDWQLATENGVFSDLSVEFEVHGNPLRLLVATSGGAEIIKELSPGSLHKVAIPKRYLGIRAITIRLEGENSGPGKLWLTQSGIKVTVR